MLVNRSVQMSSKLYDCKSLTMQKINRWFDFKDVNEHVTTKVMQKFELGIIPWSCENLSAFVEAWHYVIENVKSILCV